MGNSKISRHDTAIALDDPSPSPLLTPPQLATLLQLDPRTLRRLELSGAVPRAIYIGALKRWRRADIDTWLASRKPA
jgi:predicted DNA-binding transcriptional regulator AlpA